MDEETSSVAALEARTEWVGKQVGRGEYCSCTGVGLGGGWRWRVEVEGGGENCSCTGMEDKEEDIM